LERKLKILKLQEKADSVRLHKGVGATLNNDNHMTEKDVELMNRGETGAVAERQGLRTEVLNVDTLDQQIDVRRRRNGVP
jgi:hypothetical protein